MPTIAEFGTELKKNPQLAQHVLNKLNQSKIESPLVKNILQTTSEATDTFYDEDGKPSEDGINAVAMMNTLAQTDKFQNMMGSKHLARKWHIRQKGIKAGEGQGATDKYIASWETNLGNADAAGFSWKQLYMGDVTSRRDWMKGMLQGQDIRNPTPTQISHALADYKDSMIAFSNQDDATHFFQQTLKANKRLVKGHIIDDAPWLDDLKWEATDLLNTMGNDENLMQGVLDVLNLKEKDGSFIKSIDRITNPRIYTQEGVKGLFISSPTSAREAFISIEQLREAESIVSVKKELAAKIARQRKADALILSVRHDTDMATFKGK